MWAERLVSELDAADERARKLFCGLSAEQLNWQPADGVWGVGQCLEHLCITNEVYLPAIARALEGKPKKHVEEVTPGWFGRLFIERFVEPSPKQKRVSAPKKIVPGSRVETSALERFLASNSATREVIGRAREYDVNQIRFRNPLISVIWFTVGTGLVIISGHERRHLLQAECVKAAEGFPG
jgi:DinB superfamily